MAEGMSAESVLYADADAEAAANGVIDRVSDALVIEILRIRRASCDGRRRVDDVVDRAIELDIVGPFVGRAQIQVRDSPNGVVVDIERAPGIVELGGADDAALYRALPRTFDIGGRYRGAELGNACGDESGPMLPA